MADIRWDYGRLQAALNDAGAEAAEEVGHRIAEAAKRHAPVDTGRLQSSIRSETVTRGGRAEVVVSANVDYAAFVEYGTRYMAARPFLRPAIREALGD